MNTTLNDSIRLMVDQAALMKQLRVRPGTPDAFELARLVGEAEDLARPRYLFRNATITEKGGDFVVLDDVKFESRVLRVNLDRTERLFPFVCTCGMELEEWGRKIDDMLQGFWADAIKELALRAALDAFFNTLRTRYHLEHVSTMSPGSLENWPISQQIPLFELLGNPVEVGLTDSLLMVPTKSVSGIVFQTDASFESCQLCPRESCPNRRAPYDETLFEREYCPAAN